MAFLVADRVWETSSVTGTGAATLLGAITDYQTFLAGIGNGNSTYYTIYGGGQWEVGIGTYSSGTNSLSRDTVLASSNSNAFVTFSAGTKNVIVAGPADGVALARQGMVLNENTITSNQDIPAGYNAMSAGPVTVNTGVTVTVPTGSTWTVV